MPNACHEIHNTVQNLCRSLIKIKQRVSELKSETIDNKEIKSLQCQINCFTPSRQVERNRVALNRAGDRFIHASIGTGRLNRFAQADETVRCTDVEVRGHDIRCQQPSILE